MPSPFAGLFDDAETRYLKLEELETLDQFVQSVPTRLNLYRKLRDQELDMMQSVANQLEAKFPQESTENLERSIKKALLLMRSCSLAMLMNDEHIVTERFVKWAIPQTEVYNTQAIDEVVAQLLLKQLKQVLLSQEMALLQPMLAIATPAQSAVSNGVAIGW